MIPRQSFKEPLLAALPSAKLWVPPPVAAVASSGWCPSAPARHHGLHEPLVWRAGRGGMRWSRGTPCVVLQLCLRQSFGCHLRWQPPPGPSQRAAGVRRGEAGACVPFTPLLRLHNYVGVHRAYTDRQGTPNGQRSEAIRRQQLRGCVVDPLNFRWSLSLHIFNLCIIILVYRVC